MMVGLKVLGLGAFMLVLITIGWSISNWRTLDAGMDLLPAVHAKEMCSCLYVMGRTADQCDAHARQVIDVDELIIDDEERRVTASGTFRTQSASWRGARYGCTLD